MKTIIITLIFLSALSCTTKEQTPAPRDPTPTELNEWTVVGVQGQCTMYHRVINLQNVYWSVCKTGNGDNSSMSTY